MNNLSKIQGFELLEVNHAGIFLLKNGEIVNYGFIRISDNAIVYFTGKGLHEIWNNNLTNEENILGTQLKKTLQEVGGEQKLIKSEHIAITPLEDIKEILS